MAASMAVQVRKFNSLSQKQIDWIAEHARIQEIKIPELLWDLMGVKRKKSAKVSKQKSDAAVSTKILKCLRRIERLLDERLPA